MKEAFRAFPIFLCMCAPHIPLNLWLLRLHGTQQQSCLWWQVTNGQWFLGVLFSPWAAQALPISLLSEAGFTHPYPGSVYPCASCRPSANLLGFSPGLWPCLEISSNFSNRNHLFS